MPRPSEAARESRYERLCLNEPKVPEVALKVRGVRGATTARANTRDAILEATRELLEHVVAANGIETDDIAAAHFTTSPDLQAEFPAVAARDMGWTTVPLLCGHEMGVEHGQQKCVRVLILWNTEKAQADIQHIYLRDAARLRQDLANGALSSSAGE